MISVITPCYNHARYISDNILSVMAQDIPHEHIIVNDGSTDKVEEILNSLNDPNIKVIHHEKNMGLCAARNTAIRAAKGEFIVPLDADDMFTPDSLSVRWKVFMAFSGLDIVHGYALKVKESHNYLSAIRDMDSGKLNRHPSRLHSQGMMFRKGLFEKYGLYFDVYSKEDKEWVYRLGVHDKSPLKKRAAIKRVKTNVAFYRRHPLSMHKLRVADKKFDQEICNKFDKRIKQLKRNFVTKENTEWL
jgi:glycosyltransferase involved in cell wall biosynthesis